jgi:hypothetical protein
MVLYRNHPSLVHSDFCVVLQPSGDVMRAAAAAAAAAGTGSVDLDGGGTGTSELSSEFGDGGGFRNSSIGGAGFSSFFGEGRSIDKGGGGGGEDGRLGCAVGGGREGETHAASSTLQPTDPLR